MKNSLCISLIVVITITGCASRQATPTQIYRPGDNEKSCRELYADIKDCKNAISIYENLIDRKERENKLHFASGFILFGFPWLLIDKCEAEQIEISAVRQRKNHLSSIAFKKNCQEQENQ